MHDITQDGSIGSRLRAFRKDRNLTQERLAERARCSVELIGKLERGERESSRIATLTSLANALGVPLSALLGRRERLERTSAGVLAVRDALLSPADLPGAGMTAGTGEPVPLAALTGAVRRGWDLYWAGDLAGLAAVLPGLIGDARLTRSESGPRASGPLAQAYQLTADLLVHTGCDDLAMVAAERALSAAAAGEDELQHAVLCGTASWVLLHQGRTAEAERVAAYAAERIEPQSPPEASPEHLTVYGSLLLSAAAPAAAASHGGDVDAYLEQAGSAATSMDADRHDYWVSFGPSQVAMQACYAHAVLGRPGAALEAAKGVRRADLLPISWGAHHLDRAQALATDNRDSGNRAAALALKAAYDVSPQWFKHQGIARSLTRELFYRRTRAGEPLETLRAAVGPPEDR